MKIENYTLAMRSEHTLSSTRSILFETELETLELEELTQQQESLQQRERQLLARLQYELLQRYMWMFGGSSGNSCGCPANEIELPEIEVPRTVERLRVVQTFSEYEKTEVSMQGCIQTDSQQIAINVELSMSRETYSERVLANERFFDPLVINMEGELPELSTNTFKFDIDNDGEKDQISKLKEGNGFLALDKNCNGSIDAGCELFGTETGNGFVELSLHDSDGNDWIDESDPIFDQLRIWTEEEGESRLIGLGEAGVGAIYLGSAYSPFEYKDAENEALGKLRSTGLFLREDGTSGTVGQIDFAKQGGRGHGQSTSPLQQALEAVERKEVV